MTPLDTSRARSDAPPVPSNPPLRASAQPGEHALRPALTRWQSIADTIVRVADRLRALTFPRLDERALIALVREPQFAPHLLANVSYAQEHEVKAGLLNRQADARRRVTALVAMQSMPVRATSPILAYGMLDKFEKRVTQQIAIERSKLAQPLSDDARYRVDKTLAELYGELIYARLVDGDVYRNALEQADAHASYALRVRPLDGALWRLRGRLAFETHRLDEADAMLQRAIACGFPRMRVLPYLAEIAYLRHDYAAVHRCFDDLPPVPPNLLAPAAAYWTT
jgi:polysaccharide biosynthesis protein PelE